MSYFSIVGFFGLVMFGSFIDLSPLGYAPKMVQSMPTISRVQPGRKKPSDESKEAVERGVGVMDSSSGNAF